MSLLASLLGTALSATPQVGQTAPDFTAKDIDGHELTLSKLVEDGPVILAFFVKARTPG
jgi:peroxiredoxin Q/BCP